jgi:CRISPR/Cas system endoribonuclease Cas6 (RAMP superfamily)
MITEHGIIQNQPIVVEWKNKTKKDINIWDFYWDALELLEQIVENN